MRIVNDYSNNIRNFKNDNIFPLHEKMTKKIYQTASILAHRKTTTLNIINVVNISLLYPNTITLCDILFLTHISQPPTSDAILSSPSDPKTMSYCNSTRSLIAELKSQHNKILIIITIYNNSSYPAQVPMLIRILSKYNYIQTIF